jgi:predicted protein tyrosine phosphatase
MKFLVVDRDEIKNYQTSDKHIVISISNIEASFADLPDSDTREGILFMRFPDFDKVHEGYKYNHLLFHNKHAGDILRFVKRYKSDIELIICQCEAGISRSAGVAAALSKILNGDDTYFFKHYLPNSLVYNTILKEYYK